MDADDQHRPGWSIRARVIAAVLALTGTALLLSGLVVYNRGQALTEQRVEADLGRAVDEFDQLARNGLDPTTGKPYSDAEALLRAAVQQSVLAPSEGVLGIVDDQVRWTAQAGVELRPEDDARFTAAMLALASADRVSQGQLSTDLRTYQYVVVPVSFGGEAPSGALVRAVDVGAEKSLLNQVWRSYLLVAIGSLLLVGLLIWILVGRLLEPIASMRRTAERITDTDLTQRIPVRGNDDLSALGGTVNRMLDRLESAVSAQRELLDDVGHELRTPITIVRGHLEVMDLQDPADVAATRTLVLDETDRMRRMVEDLLTLARAERPDFVRPEPTDVARLTDETLSKATALADRHWVLDALADVEVSMDPQRIAQAWLQLAANAVTFSAPGTTIGMGSRLRDGELWLSVRDEGVGMSEQDQQRVTRRFERGGATSTAGTGLGLAIVSAIAQAHHGRLDIASTPGEGSTMSMVVPTSADGAR